MNNSERLLTIVERWLNDGWTIACSHLTCIKFNSPLPARKVILTFSRNGSKIQSFGWKSVLGGFAELCVQRFRLRISPCGRSFGFEIAKVHGHFGTSWFSPRLSSQHSLSCSLSFCLPLYRAVGVFLFFFSIIFVKINFSDLWLILFKGAEGTATTEWERHPPQRLVGQGWSLLLLSVWRCGTYLRGLRLTKLEKAMAVSDERANWDCRLCNENRVRTSFVVEPLLERLLRSLGGSVANFLELCLGRIPYGNFHTKATSKKSRPPSGSFRPNPPELPRSLSRSFSRRKAGWKTVLVMKKSGGKVRKKSGSTKQKTFCQKPSSFNCSRSSYALSYRGSLESSKKGQEYRLVFFSAQLT